MRFKLLVLAVLVAAFSVGFVTSNANAQLPDGIMTMIELGGDTGFYKYDKDYAKNADPYYSAAGGTLPKGDGRADSDFNYLSLNGVSSVKFIGKKGNVFFMANLSPWNMGGTPGVSYKNHLPDENNLVNTSFFYAKYDDPNGMWSLQVGQDVMPFSCPNFNDSFRLDYGGPYGSFNFFPFQVRLNVKGFYLSLMHMKNSYDKPIIVPVWEPNYTTPLDDTDGEWTGYAPMLDDSGNLIMQDYGTDTIIPAIVVGYEIGNLVMTPVWFNIGFVYNQFKIDDDRLEGAENGKTVKAYRLGVSFKYDGIVPKLFDFIAHGYYGINAGQLNMGVPNITMAAYNSVVFDGTDFKNTTGFGGAAGIAIKLGIHKLAMGFGFDQEKTDITGLKADKDMELWGNFWYYVDSNFQIVPSVIYYNHMKDMNGKKQGTELMYGIFWKASV